MDDLNIDVQLGKEYQYHSTFICNVSKEVASAENPPLRLECGHVFGKQSVMKLSV